MTCQSCAPSLRNFGRLLKQTASLMVGMPDYDTYLTHARAAHPDQTPMTWDAFVRNRVDHRYGDGPGRVMRCC